MKVRAVAAPSKDSTAVGAVELDCTPHGLCMTYLGVGAYQTGYAPGALTQGTRVVAPWQDVIDVRTHEGAVLVSVNPSITPHHKLYLKNFAAGDVDETERSNKQRILRIATIGFMAAVTIAVTASVPAWSPGASQALAFGLGVAAALFVLLASFLSERVWLAPRPDSDELSRRFLAEVQIYRPLPVLPALTHARAPAQLAELLALLPRSATAVVIVLSAGSLAAVLSTSWILRSAPPAPRVAAAVLPAAEPPRLPAEQPPAAARPEPPPTVTSATTAATPPELPAPPLGASCRCERPDSVLWRLPLPRLSTLMIEQRLRFHEDHHHVELELAVVNNGQTDLSQIALSVDFFEGEEKKPTKHRPLYYESTLRPGQAIKWSVEARGSSFIVNNPRNEVLEPDAVASADAFADLLDANHRPVRLHGAMMLAYHGDPRAIEGATKLSSALREEEGPFLERVLAAAASTVACDLRSKAHLDGHTVELCAFNRGHEPKDALTVRVRGLDRAFDFRSPVAAPPIVAVEQRFDLPGALAAGEGRWLSLEIATRDARAQVESFEAFLSPSAP